MAKDEAEKTVSIEERLFDFVFKDVPIDSIYIREWHVHSINTANLGTVNLGVVDTKMCDVCIDNHLGVSHDLIVYYSTDAMSFTGNAYLTVPWSQTWKFKRSTNESLYQSVFLKDFYNYCIDDIKRSIGSTVLKLVEQHIVNGKARLLEIWQHQFANDKPLFRCTSLEQLLVEMDLHGGNADGD